MDSSTQTLQIRLAALRAAQNSDGGWGYSKGRQSWLEPTCYALLALHGDPESTAATERGWNLIASWQNADGGWRPAANVAGSCWASALCISLHTVRRRFDNRFARGVGWLLGTTGSEGRLLERLLYLYKKPANDFDRTLKGWPWRPDSASWVEPTSHALVALKLATGFQQNPEVRRALQAGSGAVARIQDAERMLLDRRTQDGGWNYGNRKVLGAILPSYPETTGVALLGLQRSSILGSGAAIEVAERLRSKTESRLAHAWLEIALRVYGSAPSHAGETPLSEKDILITALEALAHPEGGHRWLRIT